MMAQVSKHFPNSLGVDDFVARVEMVRMLRRTPKAVNLRSLGGVSDIHNVNALCSAGAICIWVRWRQHHWCGSKRLQTSQMIIRALVAMLQL